MPFRAAYLPGDLVLPYKGREYRVKPPDRRTGAKLAAINAAGVSAYMALQDRCPTCGRAGQVVELPEETQALLAEIEHENLADLALGADVAAQMDADGVPAAHIDTMAIYALYYWTLGEATADAIMEAQAAGDEAGKAPASSGSSTSKRGRRTASASPTRTASTPDTGESRPS